MTLSGFKGGRRCSAITNVDVDGDAFRHIGITGFPSHPIPTWAHLPYILRHFRSSNPLASLRAWASSLSLSSELHLLPVGDTWGLQGSS